MKMDKKFIFVALLMAFAMVFTTSFSTLGDAVDEKNELGDPESTDYYASARVRVRGTGPWPNFGGAYQLKAGLILIGPRIELNTGNVWIDGHKESAPLTIIMTFYRGFWSLSPAGTHGASIGLTIFFGIGLGVILNNG
jgi:hypothetical protein